MKILNQMAESSFFNFPTLKDSEQITLPEDDSCLDNEEEYDALNDETFGDIEYGSTLDDWEKQHEEFAGFAKNSSSKEDEIVDSLRDLVLSPSPLNLTGNSVWAYTPTPKNGETPSIHNLLPRVLKRSHLETQGDEPDAPKTPSYPPNLPVGKLTPKICTVEELEKSLIKGNVGAAPVAPPPNLPLPSALRQPPPGYRMVPPAPYFNRSFPMPPHQFQGHPYPMGGPPNRYPPGFPPANLNMTPPMRQMVYPRFRPMPPHSFMKGNNGVPQRPIPGLPYPNHLNHHQQGPMPPHMQRGYMHMMPPPLHNVHPMHQQQYQHHHNQTMRQNDGNRDKNAVRDEYEGLMTAREKQWLLNIQMLQLNTGTPYFDDYYYTIYKERKARSNKENQLQQMLRHQQGRQRRNSDRQENTLTPKVYTPLQFENSLGKLQCGSVMAPRKIIDMDVVTCDKDSEGACASTKDTKKTKQLLLELEALYSMFLKAEDLTNPMAISNLKTLKEIKLKQRIRELENATTAEQKQEILEMVKKDSETVVENPNDYMLKIVTALLAEDKFTSFMNIRKGKMLLLRLLPVIHSEQFFSQTVEIWGRLLSSIPIIGRRDTAGDKILPKLYPLFKRYTQTVKMENILENVQGLTEVTRLENSRSTPLGHQSKAPLYFVLMNQFGISAVTAFLVRSEYLMSSNGATESQQTTLFNFILTVADQLVQISKIPSPLEGLSQLTFNKLCQRIPNLNPDKTSILRRYLVEAND